MLGVSRPIYVNVDSPNLGFPYLTFLGGYQLKKHPVYENLPLAAAAQIGVSQNSHLFLLSVV